MAVEEQKLTFTAPKQTAGSKKANEAKAEWRHQCAAFYATNVHTSKLVEHRPVIRLRTR